MKHQGSKENLISSLSFGQAALTFCLPMTTAWFSYFSLNDFRMTLKNGFGQCLLFVLSANGWKDQNMDSSFSCQRKPLCCVEKALFDWPIVLQYDVKAKYWLISRKFSGMTFFHSRVCSTNQKPRTFVSLRQTNQIALFPFVCCFCFVRVFSFQS